MYVKKDKKTDTQIVLMMGNPNVGKSHLFNRLTGGSAVVSNYPGTTVDVTRGVLTKSGKRYEIIDVPGAYSLDARDAAEEVAVAMLSANKHAIVMAVLDATRIERGLYMVLEIIERKNPVFVVINMIDAAHDRKITIDSQILQKILGIPVVLVSAATGQGLSDIVTMIEKAESTDISDITVRAFEMDNTDEPGNTSNESFGEGVRI